MENHNLLVYNLYYGKYGYSLPGQLLQPAPLQLSQLYMIQNPPTVLQHIGFHLTPPIPMPQQRMLQAPPVQYNAAVPLPEMRRETATPIGTAEGPMENPVHPDYHLQSNGRIVKASKSLGAIAKRIASREASKRYRERKRAAKRERKAYGLKGNKKFETASSKYSNLDMLQFAIIQSLKNDEEAPVFESQDQVMDAVEVKRDDKSGPEKLLDIFGL